MPPDDDPTVVHLGDPPDDRWGADPDQPRDEPVSSEVEQVVLGAILYKNDNYDAVCDLLNAEHFAEPHNQCVWQAASWLLDQGRPATVATVGRVLELHTSLENGGREYLFGLASNPYIGSAKELRDHAQVVVDYWQERQLVHFAQEVMAGEIRSIAEAEAHLMRLAEGLEHGDGPKSAADASLAAVQAIEDDRKRIAAGETIGLPTGLAALDMTLLMQAGNLIILGARPSMGKTALAVTIALNVARAEATKDSTGSVYVSSLEMSAAQNMNRILARYAKVGLDEIERRTLTDEQMDQIVEARRLIAGLPLYIDDDASLTVPTLRARLRRHKRRHGLSLVIVDYLQLMTPAERRASDGRNQDVSEISRGLKMLAKELGVPILALSQLSRKCEEREDKRPGLADLRDSGSIEQDADAVGFIFREDYYLAKDRPRRRGNETAEHLETRLNDHAARLSQVAGICEVIIAKQRQGPTGTARLYFHRQQTYFTDLVETPADQEPGDIPF